MRILWVAMVVIGCASEDPGPGVKPPGTASSGGMVGSGGFGGDGGAGGSGGELDAGIDAPPDAPPDGPCVPSVDKTDACNAAGQCWFASNGCAEIYDCGGSVYPEQDTPACPAPGIVVAGCPENGGQCVGLGEKVPGGGGGGGEWLACCQGQDRE